MQPIYTINFKGGCQFNTEEVHLSQLPEDLKNEVALQELETAIRAKNAADTTMECARKAVAVGQMANSIAEKGRTKGR